MKQSHEVVIPIKNPHILSQNSSIDSTQPQECNKATNNNLVLFMYTVTEYMRFAAQLPIETDKKLMDEFGDKEYVAIQTRLMLLRKYTSKGSKNNVYYKNLIQEAIVSFPHEADKLCALSESFDKCINTHLTHILPDGSMLSLYETIEHSMYGLYLHADADKIQKINNMNQALRFTCTRQYVIDVENAVFALYEMLKRLGVKSDWESDRQHASVIVMDETQSEGQQISGSGFWKNLHGHDATLEEIHTIPSWQTEEHLTILNTATTFLNYLSQNPIPVSNLKQMVYPAIIKQWGDFSEAKSFYNSIPNPGISTTVRYSSDNSLAYVRILPHVKKSFIIDAPQIITDLYEISLSKGVSNRWYIYSIGGHLKSKFLHAKAK